MAFKDKANAAGNAAVAAASKVASLPVPAWVKLLVIVGAAGAAVLTGSDEAVSFIRDTMF